MLVRGSGKTPATRFGVALGGEADDRGVLTGLGAVADGG